MCHHNHRQGFFGGKVGRRQEIATRDVISLELFIELQWNAGGSQRFQITKDGAPTNAARLSQGTGVVAASRLKQL